MKILRAFAGWRPPIAAVFIFGFGGLIAGAIAAVLLVALDISQRNTNELMRQAAELSIDGVVATINHHLQPPRSQVEFLANRLSAGDVPLDDDSRLQDLLLGSLAAAPQITAVVFVRSDLHAVRAGRQRGRYDASAERWLDRPEVRLAIREGPGLRAFTWGEVLYLNTLQGSYITLRAPVRQDGQFRGLVIAVVSIAELSNSLAATTQPFAGRTFVLRGQEEVIAHAALVGGAPNRSAQHPLPMLKEIGDPVLASLWTAPSEPAQDILEGSHVTGRIVFVSGEAYDYDDAYIFLYRQITEYGGQPWLVGLYFKLADVNAPVLRLVAIGAIGAGILVVAVILALLLGRGLSRPIRRLAVAAEAMRGLHFDEIKPVGRSVYRELDLAGRAFDAMAAGLRWFETYVPRALVARLIGAETLKDLASEERGVTVLFTDIAGFSEIAGRLPAAQLAEFLNRHFALLGACIEAEEGTIDKYIGDSVMAFWGAPTIQPDHAQRACRAALAIAQTLRADNERRSEKGLRPVRVRIGIHSGTVIVGNVGAPGRINYTLIGDTVNIAQRLEQLAKDFDPGTGETVVLLSADVAATLPETFSLQPIGEHLLRGQAEPIEVCRLLQERG
ncbi:MAG TPA: adenylate/guanylate cyclase domain-containing protein [Dongiaceae bacterium]